ncbi:MAG: pectinesterase family protein [Turicibacter sp.]|nr:pectinesterase family protein [Turicibacter sp.]
MSNRKSLFKKIGTTCLASLMMLSSAPITVFAESLSPHDDSSEREDGKIEFWDFGGNIRDASFYINRLTPEMINAWYPGVEPGTAGVTIGQFDAGDLSFRGAGNDRLRTENEALTRFDQRVWSFAAQPIPAQWYLEGEQRGVIHLNGATNVNNGNPTRSMILHNNLEDDEISFYVTVENAANTITFEYVPEDGSESGFVHREVRVVEVGHTVLNFVAPEAGSYRIFADHTSSRLAIHRVTREAAVYASIAGTLAMPEAVPADFELVFTNTFTNKSYPAVFNADRTAYTVEAMPAGFTYAISLENANGFILESATEVFIPREPATINMDVVIIGVDLFELNGEITGLPTELLEQLVLQLTPPAGQLFMPTVEIDVETGQFSALLERGGVYDLTVLGVNDFETTVTHMNADTTVIPFTKRATFPVQVETTGLTAAQQETLVLTFENMQEDGYRYTFAASDDMALRDGVYRIVSSGIDRYPLEMALTANLVIDGEGVARTLNFRAVNQWDFRDVGADRVTAGYFQGIRFVGNIGWHNQIRLIAQPNSVVNIPVNPGDVVEIGYTFAADFTFSDGLTTSDPVITNSGSTNLREFARFEYAGTEPGFVSLMAQATSYYETVRVFRPVPFQADVTVGADGRDFATINEALDAIALMDREVGQRVTVWIDPGNYEEMLVITEDEVTFRNASDHPSIALRNSGVDIDDDAVRITSYYGHGISYFSMGPDGRFDAEVLAVNLENGYHSITNPGAGTATFWNATVVVRGTDFEAFDIIFENSFNQYVSEREMSDRLYLETSNRGGERPRELGSTAVQDRAFVERAAAMAVMGDRAYFNNVRFVGRQDTLYGGAIRAAFNQSVVMGGVDFIFGPMTAVFYDSDLVLNTSDVANDVAYIAAAQQPAGRRGYLFYNNRIVSAVPGVDTASTRSANPGYLGRPWAPTTSEVAFVNTTIGVGDDGVSLIRPAGWLATLGGQAPSFEYGTVELSGVDHSAARAAWATVLDTPFIGDVELVPYSFTSGDDGWDPFGSGDEGDASVSIFLIGDSTVSPHPDTFDNWDVFREGWGERLQPYLSEEATVVNLAVSGRTSLDFVTAGASAANYQRFLNEMTAGDYVLIQFGHNDQRSPNISLEGDHTTPGSFQFFLYQHYVRPALDAGAQPVLISPVVRRRFVGDVFMPEAELMAFGEAARQLALVLDLPFIDLNAMTAELYRSVGSEGTVRFHALPRGASVASLDNTHFSAIGAHYVANELINGVLANDHEGLARLATFISDERPATPELPTPDRPILESVTWEDGDKVWDFSEGADYFRSVYGFEHGFIGNGISGIMSTSASFGDRQFTHMLNLGGAPQMWIDRDGNTVEGGFANQANDRFLPAARFFSFQVDGPSTITVYANHGGAAGQERFLDITNDVTWETSNLLIVDGADTRRGTFEYTGEEPATIFIYSRGSGINILTVEATNVTGPASSGGGEPTPDPELPCMPGIPSLPSLPSIPGVPDLPSLPCIPVFPGIPGLPSLPEIPGVPAFPEIPGLSGLPNIPAIPPIPGRPIPAVPELPPLPAIPRFFERALSRFWE